jgi:plastocyanin
VDGEEYIAVPSGKALWAFKLNGTMPERPAPPVPPTEYGFQGIVQSLGPADEIGMAVPQSISGAGSHEQFIDEYSFTPGRAQAPAGQSIKFTNYGIKTHTIVAADGSWTTGPVAPGQSASVTINKPGKYVYFATEFPFSKAQLSVQ